MSSGNGDRWMAEIHGAVAFKAVTSGDSLAAVVTTVVNFSWWVRVPTQWSHGNSVSDRDLLDPDPYFSWIAVQIHGFDDLKLKRKNITAEKNLLFFKYKTAVFVSLCPHKGRPSYGYRRNLQPSKENIQNFETWYFLTFFVLFGSFLASWIRIRIPNSESGSTDLIEFGSNPDPEHCMETRQNCFGVRKHEVKIGRPVLLRITYYLILCHFLSKTSLELPYSS